MAEEKGSSLSLAADRIRETAKWVTVSLAALGGVLVAGSQLSDIGALEPFSNRFNVAIGGGITAALASTCILALAIWTATTPAVSLTQLAASKPPRGLTDVLNEPRYLDGKANVHEFDTAYSSAQIKRDKAFTTLMQQDTPGHREAAADADSEFVYLNGVALRLLDVVAYTRLAYRWKRAGMSILGLGLVAAAGIGAFAWAANPPEDAVASVVTPSVLQAASPVSVSLTSQGREALAEALGSTCPVDMAVRALRLGRTDAGPDVLVQQNGCKRIRFIAVPAWASIQ